MAARPGATNAADRHVGEQAEHDQRHERAQIAAAGARQVAARTTASEHHAEAEDHSAGDVADPAQRRRHVHRLFQRDHAARLQQLCADQCGGRGQAPRRGKRRQSPKIQDVAQRAHGAVVGAEHDGAEQEAQCQPADGQGQGAVPGQKLTQGIHIDRYPVRAARIEQ
jgi:hypothetical protein